MSTQMKFNEIPSGRKFKVPSGVTYQKIDSQKAKAVQKVDGTVVANGLITTSFYNSKMMMTIVN
jgi:hypothetical protein